jgi:hypothetical protein
MIPLVMVGQGAAPVMDGMDPEAVRRRLCAGRDVTVTILVSRETDRLLGWEDTVGWGSAAQQVFAQRDGVPVLVAATWRATNRPDSSPCES